MPGTWEAVHNDSGHPMEIWWDPHTSGPFPEESAPDTYVLKTGQETRRHLVPSKFTHQVCVRYAELAGGALPISDGEPRSYCNHIIPQDDGDHTAFKMYRVKDILEHGVPRWMDVAKPSKELQRRMEIEQNPDLKRIDEVLRDLGENGPKPWIRDPTGKHEFIPPQYGIPRSSSEYSQHGNPPWHPEQSKAVQFGSSPKQSMASQSQQLMASASRHSASRYSASRHSVSVYDDRSDSESTNDMLTGKLPGRRTGSSTSRRNPFERPALLEAQDEIEALKMKNAELQIEALKMENAKLKIEAAKKANELRSEFKESMPGKNERDDKEPLFPNFSDAEDLIDHAESIPGENEKVPLSDTPNIEITTCAPDISKSPIKKDLEGTALICNVRKEEEGHEKDDEDHEEGSNEITPKKEKTMLIPGTPTKGKGKTQLKSAMGDAEEIPAEDVTPRKDQCWRDKPGTPKKRREEKESQIDDKGTMPCENEGEIQKTMPAEERDDMSALHDDFPLKPTGKSCKRKLQMPELPDLLKGKDGSRGKGMGTGEEQEEEELQQDAGTHGVSPLDAWLKGFQSSKPCNAYAFRKAVELNNLLNSLPSEQQSKPLDSPPTSIPSSRKLQLGSPDFPTIHPATEFSTSSDRISSEREQNDNLRTKEDSDKERFQVAVDADDKPLAEFAQKRTVESLAEDSDEKEMLERISELKKKEALPRAGRDKVEVVLKKRSELEDIGEFQPSLRMRGSGSHTPFLDLTGSGAEHCSLGVFVMLSFMLALVGLRKFQSFRKLALELQAPLVRT